MKQNKTKQNKTKNKTKNKQYKIYLIIQDLPFSLSPSQSRELFSLIVRSQSVYSIM